jgi:hypothetical protein
MLHAFHDDGAGDPRAHADATALLEVHQLGAAAPAFVVFTGADGCGEARRTGGAWLRQPNTVQVLLHHRDELTGAWTCCCCRWSPLFGGADLPGFPAWSKHEPRRPG